MNIIVTTHDSLQPILGGGGTRTLKTAEEFVRRGHEVIIVAPADDAAKINGIPAESLAAPRKQRSQILSSIKFNVRLCKKIISHAGWADVVFVHNTIAAAIVPFLRKWYRFKFSLDITDIHSEYILMGERTAAEKFLTSALLYFEYWIIREADSITVATNCFKELLVSKGVAAGKIEVVYDGAELDRISSAKGQDYFFNIIHLGLVDKQHGVDVLIRSLHDVLREFPQVRCYIVGDGRELPRVKKLALELGVIESCIFTGQLDCQSARRYLEDVGIGIIPRRDSLPNRVVTTLKLLEYWASSTCVISSKLAGIAEIGNDNEDIIFFEPGNHNELSLKILAMLRSPERVASLRANGFNRAQDFRWDDLVTRIADKALE
ncbi:MAG: glycosyltransferase family 4 protein [Geobacteraceae bacterium]|nr:glycosyltransferase family 4 protein [Geobacteraceae bacterium]